MALKLKIIINPSSGRETARYNVEDTLAYLSSFNELERADLYYTMKQHDAERYAAETDPAEYDYIIAAGGDGTVNEVITGLMKNGIDIPLAIYTSGTVNDFATINHLPSLPSDFARMLMHPEIKVVDCGKANDFYFLNVLAGGMMSDVSYRVPSSLKTTFGPAAYWMSAIKDIPSLNTTIPVTFRTDRETIDDDVIMFFVSNSKSVGGFRNLMTRADLQDGLLDVLAVKKIDFGSVFPLLGNLLTNDHIYNDKVIYFQTNRLEITTSGDRGVVLDVDGEKGPSLPVSIECIPKAIRLLVPGEEEDR